MKRSTLLAPLVIVSLARSASADRPAGVDVSHFQNSSGIPESNYAQMATQGNQFVYVKASEGLTGPDDATMQANVANASAAGLLTGVYHFCHAENRPTPAGAVQEADHFLTYAGADIGPGHLRPALDVEGAALTGLSTTALTSWVIAFSNEIVAQRGASAEPVIYTTAPTFFDSRMSTYDLWIRDITGGPNQPTGSPPIGPFGNWAFWQYNNTSTVGGIGPIDQDILNSDSFSLADLTITPEPASAVILLTLGAMTLAARRRRCV